MFRVSFALRTSGNLQLTIKPLRASFCYRCYDFGVSMKAPLLLLT
jgi:hypothetical protein